MHGITVLLDNEGNVSISQKRNLYQCRVQTFREKGRPDHPDPQIRRGGRWSRKKNFSALQVSVQSKNKGKPSPGSAAVYFFWIYDIYILEGLIRKYSLFETGWVMTYTIYILFLSLRVDQITNNIQALSDEFHH